jgi:hypothetical protein
MRKLGDRDLRPCADQNDLQRTQRLYRHAARYLSHYLNRARVYDRDAFDKWVSSSWTQNWQTMKIAGVPDTDRAIEIKQQRIGFVGLTERFDESLLLLGQWLAEPDFRVEYRRVNQLQQKRRPRDIVREQTDTSYLKTQYARQRIAEANAEDQKLYDYAMTRLYPRQVAAYRGDLAADVRQLQQRNQSAGRLHEPLWPAFYRNCVYKPLLRLGML